MEATVSPIEMGKSIADMGFVIMAAAGYLVYSATIVFIFVKWFIRVLDSIMERQQVLNEILQLLKELHSMIKSTTNH